MKKFFFLIDNMFWAITKTIYQLFKIRLKYPEELGQTKKTIIHAIKKCLDIYS